MHFDELAYASPSARAKDHHNPLSAWTARGLLTGLYARFALSPFAFTPLRGSSEHACGVLLRRGAPVGACPTAFATAPISPPEVVYRLAPKGVGWTPISNAVGQAPSLPAVV